MLRSVVRSKSCRFSIREVPFPLSLLPLFRKKVTSTSLGLLNRGDDRAGVDVSGAFCFVCCDVGDEYTASGVHGVSGVHDVLSGSRRSEKAIR